MQRPPAYGTLLLRPATPWRVFFDDFSFENDIRRSMTARRSHAMKNEKSEPSRRPITSYPPGALVRSSDICRDPRRGYAGILPIDRSTWHRWVKSGKAPAGRSLAGTSTRVWEIEAVRSLGTSTS